MGSLSLARYELVAAGIQSECISVDRQSPGVGKQISAIARPSSRRIRSRFFNACSSVSSAVRHSASSGRPIRPASNATPGKARPGSEWLEHSGVAGRLTNALHLGDVARQDLGVDHSLVGTHRAVCPNVDENGAATNELANHLFQFRLQHRVRFGTANGNLQMSIVDRTTSIVRVRPSLLKDSPKPVILKSTTAPWNPEGKISRQPRPRVHGSMVWSESLRIGVCWMISLD